MGEDKNRWSANHLSQFGTANHLSQFGTANHLSQFGTAERESFESVRDRGARIICVSSGPRSANH